MTTIAPNSSSADANPPGSTPRVVLRPKKARPFFGRHPWVLQSAVAQVDGSSQDGDVVDLVTERGLFVARGIFNGQSRLRVRLYSWNPQEPLDQSFWRRRLATAWELRSRQGLDDPAGAVRLVSSEADGLSGLVVERYGDQLVVQVLSMGIAQRLDTLVPLLVELGQPRGIILRVDREMAKFEGLSLEEGSLWGETPEEPIFIKEHGLRYGVDLRAGQKTGFYLDQRENRRAAARWCAGRRVLDLCCYTGGFALAAARLGSAREVIAVDSSAKALTLARANAELNSIHPVRFEAADCFRYLAEARERHERFDVVILDPPKFAPSRQHVPAAIQAYHRLNRLAVDVLEPGGILVTCSCSGQLTREDFAHVLSGVAEKTQRSIQIVEMRGAAPDHPVSASCLESEYLKCFICRVG